MIPQVAKAMSAGFTAKQVIDYLIKKFPNHADKIKNALAAGYTVDQVAKYLGGGKKALNQLENLQQNSNEINTEFSKTRQKDIEKEQFNNKAATGAGIAAVGSLAAPMAATAMSRALPQNLLRLGQGTQILPQSNPVPSQSPMSPGPNSPGAQVMGGKPPINPIQGAQPQPSPNNVTQPPIKPQAPLAQRDPQKNIELIKSVGIEPNLKNMIKGGMSIPDIAAVLPKMIGKESAKSLKLAEGGIEGAIEDYAKEIESTQEVPDQENSVNPLQEDVQELENILPEDEENIEESKPIEHLEPIKKNQTVVSPHGVGEIKEIRNGKALVEVDGKIHKVDEEDIIQSPVTEKELDELYDDLIKGIEKSTGKQVSRNVDWAGYDPKTNELAYKPHGSDRLYAYGDISPEDVELLTSLLTRRKTTGQNLIGAWEKDTESPIGAAMYQLIKKLQSERGGKGSEYKNRYDTIYDALEPAKMAKKKKYEEQRKKAKKPRIS